MQKTIRGLKDKLIRDYYRFRIYQTQNPYQIFLRREPYKILLILSHMRSGSSLLTHILATNPEIIGYGETHLKYQTEADFKALLQKVYWAVRGYQMHHTYVLDKLLHDSKLTPEILRSPQIYMIFLVREPVATIASLLKLKTDWTEAKALDYYIKRLGTLEQYAKISQEPQRKLFLTYSDLLERSEKSLALLRSFLQVRSPFAENYQVLPTTGFKGVGDSSDKIKAGHIVRDQKILKPELSDATNTASQAAFEQCIATLQQYAATIRCNNYAATILSNPWLK
jgi:hypothetical protein